MKRKRYEGRKYLYPKQKAVLEDIFCGEMEEKAVLEKHRVSRKTYDKWLRENAFSAEFVRRIRAMHRQSELILARYKGLAAAKLVALTESEKDETARRACLDIIMMNGQEAGKENPEKKAEDKERENLSSEKAQKILMVLAESQ